MSIISPNMYDASTSLNQNIATLSDKSKQVNNAILINLIAKYFFAYAYPESVDQKIPLAEIDEKFARATRCCKGSKEAGIIDVVGDLSIEELMFYKTFYEAGYGMSMLGDISATAAIVKDIINSSIDPKDFDSKYLGLDLGTGTGILLLAQYIQALRNGFQTIENIGIEIDKTTVLHSSAIVDKLGVGKVIEGDTTKEEIYNALIGGNKITFISNENIPTTTVRMNGKNDPFHQNNYILYQTSVKNNLCEQTQTFPEEIAMTLQIGEIFQRTIAGSHENGFLSDFLVKFEKSVKESKEAPVPEDWSVLDHLFVEGIALGGTFVPVHEIGKYLIDNQSVAHLPDRRYRWSDKGFLMQQEGQEGTDL